MLKFKELFFVFAMLGVASCDPCEQLANKICDCEETPAEQERCKKELELRKSHSSFDQARDVEACKKALTECTSCKALQNHEIEKCGMTRGAD